MKKIKVIDIIKKPSSSEGFFQSREQIKKDLSKKPEVFVKELKAPQVEKEEKSKELFVHRKEHHTAYHHQEVKKESRGVRIYFFIGVAVVGLVVLVYLLASVLPKAEIKVSAKKAEWNYENSVTINNQIAEADVLDRSIPAATITQKKNTTITWPATGKKFIERKATGTVLVYNAYGTSPQVLVAGTRFQAVNGKIFRLKDRIVVPGAKLENGKIIPVNIAAEVVADQAGPEYNISPVKKFTIPGFSGSDKFEKFYAESKEAMAGGFIGDGKYPTPDDISKAKSEAENQIRGILTSFIDTQIPQGKMKFIENSRQFKILKETVNEATDQTGNFSVFVEAEGTVRAFSEEELLKLMSQLGKQVAGNDYEIKTYNITYGDIKEDAKAKTASLPVKFISVFWKPIDEGEFKKQVLGKSENDLRAFIFGSSNIEKADISFWPFWVSQVPENEKRVKLVIE